MWKIKTVKTEKNLNAEKPGDRLMLHVTSVFENTETNEEVTIPFVIESKELMDKTLLRTAERLNKTETDVAATPNGEAYEPTVPEVPVQPEPTEEEKAAALWVENWERYKQAKKGIDALAKAEITPTEEEMTRFNALKQWVADNRKPEYTPFL